MVKLEDLKISLRITHDIDDQILQSYIDTAEAYVMSAVNSKATKEEYNKYRQFDFATSLLAQSWYLSPDGREEIPTAVKSMINQLRGAMA
ncbi:head-tail connector protein [Holzapfeliella sp. JNUCC 72]